MKTLLIMFLLTTSPDGTLQSAYVVKDNVMSCKASIMAVKNILGATETKVAKAECVKSSQVFAAFVHPNSDEKPKERKQYHYLNVLKDGKLSVVAQTSQKACKVKKGAMKVATSWCSTSSQLLKK